MLQTLNYISQTISNLWRPPTVTCCFAYNNLTLLKPRPSIDGLWMIEVMNRYELIGLGSDATIDQAIINSARNELDALVDCVIKNYDASHFLAMLREVGDE